MSTPKVEKILFFSNYFQITNLIIGGGLRPVTLRCGAGLSLLRFLSINRSSLFYAPPGPRFFRYYLPNFSNRVTRPRVGSESLRELRFSSLLLFARIAFSSLFPPFPYDYLPFFVDL